MGNNLKIRKAKSNSAVSLTPSEHVGKKFLSSVGTIKIAKEIRFLVNAVSPKSNKKAYRVL